MIWSTDQQFKSPERDCRRLIDTIRIYGTAKVIGRFSDQGANYMHTFTEAGIYKTSPGHAGAGACFISSFGILSTKVFHDLLVMVTLVTILKQSRRR